jgi:hypothetical protein
MFAVARVVHGDPCRQGDRSMTFWKPVALVSMSALALVVGHQAASASYSHDDPKPVAGDFRRMHAALDSLRAARIHLENAEHNHGGWRERAIESTDRAIHETEAALNWSP